MRTKDISGLLRRVLKVAIQGPLEREREFYRRLRELSDYIELMPESITHYVLRGELLSKRGEYERARADFETAVEIAEATDPNKKWGLLQQVMRDNALHGIELVERRR